MDEIIDYRGKSPRKTPFGIPLITAKVVKGGRILPPDEFIDESDYDEWMRRGMPKRGDVLITTEAPLGEVAQLSDERVALAQRIIALRASPKLIDGGFLKYSMQSPFVQDQLHARATGSTVMGIRQSELRQVVLAFPALQEQRAIADLLGALDDKIELNRRMNATLEMMARSLYQAWFVDFEPVRAKASGASSSPLMTRHVFDAMPRRFVESRLGLVPDGWPILPLHEAIDVNPPRYLSKEATAPYLDMASMPTHGHAAENWIERPFGSGTRFQNGDTLVARITPCLENGKTAFVDFLTNSQIGWGSTEYIVLRPRSPLPRAFAYYLARSESFRSFAIQRMSGSSGRQRVPVDALQQFYMCFPPAVLAQAFGDIVEPLMRRRSHWFCLISNPTAWRTVSPQFVEY